MRKLVGLVPAAGHGTRVSFLPCSKEIFPVGFTAPEGNGDERCRPKAISLYLLERMKVAGVSRVFIVLSREKWDIVRYYGSGAKHGLDIAYLVQDNVWGMPYALAVASPWLNDTTVLFGMPDTIFSPFDAYERLLLAHSKTGADLTLGLFPTATPQRFGMVAYDTSFRMLYTVDKPPQTDLTYMWGIACWGPVFTEFLDHWVQNHSRDGSELVLADVFQAAIDNGLDVKVLPFEDGEYLDIGDPEELASAVLRFARRVD